jgi:uncharacterized protein with von Willebrand factor type A (vWA) domain
VNGGAAPTAAVPPAVGRPERAAVAFARLLRGAGLAVPPDVTVAYAEALAAVGLGRPEGVYWAGRATLVRRPEDIDVYDQLFDAFWLDRLEVRPVVVAPPVPVEVATDDDGDDPAPGGEGGDKRAETAPAHRLLRLRYSRHEMLAVKDFAECTPDELAELHRLMSRLRLGGSLRRTRRRRPSGRRGRWPDLRRTVRLAVRSDGTPLRRAWSDTATRPRRLVLLCDVSGSMEPYARQLVRFLHLAVTGRQRVEAFTLGTRLTRVTRELSLHDPDLALARVARAVPDWSGGTRLGDGLAEFNERWGVRGLARGAVVVILSDGWDRGDPGRLAEEMRRLSLVAHRVLWVNPLKATPGFEPLVRGLAAALPYTDELLEGHSLRSLADLAEVVAR